MKSGFGIAGGLRAAAALKRVSRGPWLWTVLVVALFCVPLFVGLGRVDLENDEAIYSFAVDVILDSGNWLTPKSSPNEDVAFLEKPPLKFWIVAAPIRLGLLPHDEFGLRFWDALFGSVAFLYVFSIGRKIGGTTCGLVAALILFVHRPLIFTHGLRTNNMEAALVLTYCGGVYHFMKWRTTASGARRRGHLLAVGLYFVLGFMTKFVAALLLPAVLLVSVLLHREDRVRLAADRRAVLAVTLLAAGLIAPWFLYQYHQFGAELWAAIGAHVFTRFKAFVDPAHLHPWNYYLSQLLTELQASGVLVIAIAGAALVLLRTTRSGWPEGVLMLAWFVLPIGLMSLGASKLYHYAYPFVPPVALAAGYAAAVFLNLLWSCVDRLVPNADPGPRNAWRLALLIGAAGAAVMALVALVLGPVRLAVGGVVLFRNSGAARPMVACVVALGLAGHLKTALRIAATLSLLAMLPLDVYRNELKLLPVEDHPLHTMRDCLQPICASHAGSDPRGPGVWVEDAVLTHPFIYYLRRLGPWEQRETESDPAVFVNLYVPDKLRPVLLSPSRFDEFTRRVRARDPGLIDEAARLSAVDRAELAASASQTEIPFQRFLNGVLMLPGPYGACVPRFGQPVPRQSR